MLAQYPDASLHTSSGICGLVGLSLFSLWYVLFFSNPMWQRVIHGLTLHVFDGKRRHVVHLVLVGGVVALLCLHTMRLAYGWIPLFCLLLWDHVWRWKDFVSRRGRIAAAGLFAALGVAFEVHVRSPWRLSTTWPLTALPGQFLLVSIEGRAALPLTISSRVLQDPKEDVASVTFHVNGSRGNRCAVRQMARNGLLVGRFVRLEGPYGGIGLRLRWYKTLLLIAGGTGASSVMSLLEAMAFQPDYYSQQTSVEHVTVILVAKTPQDLTMYATELHEVLIASRPFDMTVYLFATAASSNPAKSSAALFSDIFHLSGASATPNNRRRHASQHSHTFEEGNASATPHRKGGGFDVSVVMNASSSSSPQRTLTKQIPPSLTSTPSRQTIVVVDTVLPNLTTPPPTTGEQHHRYDSERHPLFNLCPVALGKRPQWSQLIQAEHRAASNRNEKRVAVHVNGPPSMIDEVLRTCATLSPSISTNTRIPEIHVDYEVYSATPY